MAYFRIYDFGSSGMQQRVDDLLSKNNEVAYLANGSIDKIGNIQSARDHEPLGTESAYSIDGLFELDDSTSRTKFRFTNGNIEKYTSDWGTFESSLFTAGEYVDVTRMFQRVDDGSSSAFNVYMVATDGDNEVVYTNGSDPTNTIPYSSDLSDFKVYAQSVATLGNILFAGGVKFTDGVDEYDYSNRVYFTDPNTFQFYKLEESTDIADSTNWIEVDGAVKKVMVVGKWIAVFADGVWIVDPLSFEQIQIADAGIAGRAGAAVHNNTLFWINEEGIWAWDGSGLPIKLNRSLKDPEGEGIWDTIDWSEQSSFVVFVDDDVIGFSVIDENAENIVLEYSYVLKAWKFDYGYGVASYARALNGTNKVTLIGASDYDVKQFRGADTYLGNLEIETKNLYMGNVETHKVFHNLVIIYKAGSSNLKIEYCVDENEGDWHAICGPSLAVELPTTAGLQVVTRLSLDSAKGSSIKFRFTYNDTSTFVDISGIAVEYEESKLRKNIG